MGSRVYYKGLDENLCGKNGYPYAIGGEFTADTDDNWHWLHFAKKVSTAIRYGNRVVEVEPMTTVQRFGRYDDQNAKTIRIVRELPREELLQKLVDEKCSFYKMVHIEPTYEELLRYRDHIRICDHFSICYEFNWLTSNQKKALLPRNWHMIINDADKLEGARHREKDKF